MYGRQGWKHPRTPTFFKLGLYFLLIFAVSPDVGHDLLIPCPAHLSAPVETLKTLKPDHQHDIIKCEVRQQPPITIN